MTTGYIDIRHVSFASFCAKHQATASLVVGPGQCCREPVYFKAPRADSVQDSHDKNRLARAPVTLCRHWLESARQIEALEIVSYAANV